MKTFQRRKFKDEHGVEFSVCGDSTVLTRMPKDFVGAYRVPDFVSSIGLCAINGCNGLTSLVIPKSVTVIEKDNFELCEQLASLVVEQGKGQTARGTAGLHDVETADGHGIQPLLLTDFFEDEIDLGRLHHVGTGRLHGIDRPFHDVLSHLHCLLLGHSFDAIDETLQVDIDGSHAILVQQVFPIHVGGDEPVGGFPEQADAGP